MKNRMISKNAPVSKTRRRLALLPAWLLGGGLLGRIVPGGSATAQTLPFPQSVRQRGIGFSVDAGLASGTYADGPVWIQVAGSARMNAPTPHQGLDGGSAVHGVQINPRMTGTQGYDQRSTGFAPYADGLNHRDWPRPVVPGDVIVKIRSRMPAPARARNGLPEEIAACFIVASPPPPGAFSPEAIGWPERGVPVPHVIDLGQRVAELPAFATGGHAMPAYEAIMARLDHYNPLYAQASPQSPEFHSQMMAGATARGYNYGRDIAVTIADGLKVMISDQFSDRQKRAAAIPILSMGLNWYGTFRNNRSYSDENGGILQFHFAAMALALAWSGRREALAELGDPGKFAGNFGQAIRITRSDLENLRPHDSDFLPYPWRRRKIAGVSGRRVTVPELSRGEAGDPASIGVFNGMHLVRERDGASAVVTGTSYPNNGTYELKISTHPRPPFAVGDVVHCVPPPGVLPAAGSTTGT